MKILFYYRGAENFGIEYISAVLKEAGHETGLIFDPGFDDTFYFRTPALKLLKVKEKLIEQAKSFSPDLMAFSSITNLYPYVKEMAYALKKELNVLAVIGGVHSNALPEYVLKEPCFDMLCLGEGEYPMLDLTQRMSQGRDFSDIDNLWVKRKDRIIRNKERPLIEDLDRLPFPDKELFYKKGAFYKDMLIMTSRGCPYHCSFCVNSFYLDKYGSKTIRRRGVDKIIEEIRMYKERYNPRFIHFDDDVFTASDGWFEEFSRRYRAEIGIEFLVNIHPAMVNRRTAILLKEAGCRVACMGVQTGNERSRLDLLRRNDSNSRIMEAARVLKDADIHLTTEFIFGLPDETEEQSWESVLFNSAIRPASTSTFIFYPFPGTELAEFSVKSGLLDEESLEMIKEGRGSYHTSLFLKNDHNHFFLNTAMLLPLFSKFPVLIRNGYFRKFCRKKTNFLHRLLGICAIPFFNPFLFREKLINYLRMFWVYLRQ